MRQPGKLDIDYYSSLLNDQKKLRLFNKEKKFFLVDKKELLREFFIKKGEKCIYCNNVLDKQCDTKLLGLRDVLRHISALEKISNSVYIYHTSENKKNKIKEIRRIIPEINLSKNELANFQEFIKSINHFGQDYGAVKLVPPKGSYF